MKPLYQEICDNIRHKIESGEYPAGAKLKAEMELINEYNVSRVTMRKAMEILVETGAVYRISGKGTFVSQSPAVTKPSQHDRLVGVILCNFSASYGIETLKALEHEISSRGYSMIFANSYFDDETETSAIKTLVDAGCKGILLQPVHNEVFSSTLMKMSLSNFPLVLLDRNLQGLSLPFVGSDNTGAILQAMKYIREMGHTNVCMFTPNPSDTSTITERISAFIHSFINKTMFNSYNTFSNITSPLVNSPNEEEIRRDIENIEKHLRAYPQITCAFASEYSVARMIRSAAKNLKLNIPNDLSLITFDNHNDKFRTNSTTFIRQRENAIAQKAVEVLFAQMDGKKECGKYLIETDLIDNGSVKDINS